ncbi:MAG: DUF6194 family protein [Ardenticatenales bacterium]
MDEATITRYLTDTFDDVQLHGIEGWTFYFYGTDRMMPFATLGTQDDAYDRASDLNRPSVFRLNIGVSKATYRSLFGPEAPIAGPDGVVQTGHDFTALDRIMPHPVYAPQSWLCVLNPSAATFEAVKPLLAEGYERAVGRQRKAETAAEGR